MFGEHARDSTIPQRHLQKLLLGRRCNVVGHVHHVVQTMASGADRTPIGKSDRWGLLACCNWNSISKRKWAWRWTANQQKVVRTDAWRERHADIVLAIDERSVLWL